MTTAAFMHNEVSKLRLHASASDCFTIKPCAAERLIGMLIANSRMHWSAMHISMVRSNMLPPCRACVCVCVSVREVHVCLVSAGWDGGSDGSNVGTTAELSLWAKWRCERSSLACYMQTCVSKQQQRTFCAALQHQRICSSSFVKMLFGFPELFLFFLQRRWGF